MSRAVLNRLISVFVCAATFTLCAMHGFDLQLTFDNQIYYYMAERVASGEPPHVSIVDHKHSLPAILSGFAMKVGRLFDVPDWISARSVSVAAAVLTVWSVWRIGLRLGGGAIAGIFSALAMLAFTDFIFQASMGLRPKVFMAAFMAASLNSFAARRMILAGALSAMSFLCWQPALAVFGSLGLAALASDERLRSVPRLIFGALVAVLCYEGYFAWHGALEEQLFQSYAMPADLDGYSYPAPWDSVLFIVRMGLWRTDHSAAHPALFLFATVATWAWIFARREAAWNIVRRRPTFSAVFLATNTALAFTFINHQAYPDMFFLYPQIAIVCGCVYAGLIDRLNFRKSRIIYAVLAILVGAGLVEAINSHITVFANRRGTIEIQVDQARQLDVINDDFGSIWAIGCPHLLSLTRKANHTPYGLLIDPKLRNMILAGTGGQPLWPLKEGLLPGAIVVSRGGERKIIPWLPRFYRHVSLPGFDSQGIRIWVVKDQAIRSAPNPYPPPDPSQEELPEGPQAEPQA